MLTDHGIECFVIDGAAHLPCIETPDAYDRLVLEVGARRTVTEAIPTN